MLQTRFNRAANLQLRLMVQLLWVLVVVVVTAERSGCYACFELLLLVVSYVQNYGGRKWMNFIQVGSYYSRLKKLSTLNVDFVAH